MPRIHRSTARSGHRILVIDDSPEMLETSRRLLEAEGHHVLTAPEGPTGLALYERERPHLLLVDYFMPEMTGEEVVRRIRRVDPHIQIILVTGYSGEKPARTMMRQLDIQGYHDKGEGAERLLLWVDSALKAYRQVRALERQRAGLEYIVNFAPDLHRLQRVEELLPGLLWQLQDLVEGGTRVPPGSEGFGGGADSQASGFVALSVQPLQDPSTALAIRAGHGRFFSGLLTDSLGDRERSAVEEAIAGRRVLLREGATVVPLRIGQRVLGVVYLEMQADDEADPRLLEVFGAQAACAIQSALLYGEDPLLYEMATRDPVTGLLLHGYWTQLSHQLLKSALRRGMPVSAVHVEVDGVDALARWAGHAGRDQALRAVGELVAEVVGDGGWATRNGADHLLVLLPDEGPERAEQVADALVRLGSPLQVDADAGAAEVRLRAGCATLSAGELGARFALLGPDHAEAALAELIASARSSREAASLAGEPAASRTIDWSHFDARGAAVESLPLAIGEIAPPLA